MPQVIQGNVNPLSIAGPDDAYVIVQPPGGAQLSNAPTNPLGWVGSASWGPLNVAQSVGSYADLLTKFGPPKTAGFDLGTDINNALALGANNHQGVRVSDTTDIAAILKVFDNTGFATQTYTVAGTFTAGNTITAVINGVSVAYTVLSTDVNNSGVAASLAVAINASAVGTGPNAIVKATSAAAVCTITALLSGTGPNAYTTTATSGALTTLTAGGTTMTGGAAPGVIATLTARYTGSMVNLGYYRMDVGSQSQTNSPTYKLIWAPPNGLAPEIFDNIVAYASVGGGFSGTTFQTNLVNAINASPALSATRGASAYWSAANGASTIAPITGVPATVSTSGTDGSTFASGATTAQVGAATSKTGMYALDGLIGGGGLVLCGNTDLANAAAAQIAFAQLQNAFTALAFPAATTTATAVTNKQTYGIASYSAILLKDFIQFNDSVNGVPARQISPAGVAAARIAITSPETSPMNQPISIVTGTERVGASQNNPYGPAELAQLETAGINIVTMGGPGGNFPMIRLNKNSLGPADPKGNIAYTRMTQFLAQSLNSVLLGQFVGLAQSASPNDPVRQKARALLNDFLGRLKIAGMIAGFLVQCDLRNNPPSQIALGTLIAAAQVQYMGIIDKFIATVQGGQTVTTTIQPAGVVAST